MTINIQTIDVEDMRYPTAADYWETKTSIEFRIAKMSDVRYEALLLIHELVEYFLVKWHGIPLKSIDEFDTMFENERDHNLHYSWEEPGNDKRAPYRKEHKWATFIERICAFAFGVKWTKYDDAVNNL